MGHRQQIASIPALEDYTGPVLRFFKRMFGKHLYSLKWKNMIQEVRIKVATYNKLIDMEAGTA